MRCKLELRTEAHRRIGKVVFMKPLSPDQWSTGHDEQQMSREIHRRRDRLGFRERRTDDRQKMFLHQKMRGQPEPVSVPDADHRAGFESILPPRRLCCGRPLYDFGYLELAKARLQDIVDILSPMLEAEKERAIGIVGLEPGCLSVFKDELPKLLPDDPRAERISRSVSLFGDFLLAHDFVRITVSTAHDRTDRRTPRSGSGHGSSAKRRRGRASEADRKHGREYCREHCLNEEGGQTCREEEIG